MQFNSIEYRNIFPNANPSPSLTSNFEIAFVFLSILAGKSLSRIVLTKPIIYFSFSSTIE